jgi:uncharacterized protein with ParB-like and HNH nuclease domain
MEAKARNLNQIFDGTVSFQIPLFQRPYVWEKERNWQPLWDDIEALAFYQIQSRKSRKHFLGAVVLEQLKNVAGSIETHQVIDGQQRFTTLQLLMLAARDISKICNLDSYFERFNDLVTNKAIKVDYEHEQFKVWPTNRDRNSFDAVHRYKGGCSALNSELTAKQLIESVDTEQENDKLIEGYVFFFNNIRKLINGSLIKEQLDTDLDTIDERMDILWKVISSALQVVVINLDDEDESQVIFETLNARGTQLLPADLVKNYLFRTAQNEQLDIESLYKNNWAVFDTDFWREEITQGRAKRPRIDVFLQHYLTLMVREEIRPAHLFEAFKGFFEHYRGLNDEQSNLGSQKASTIQTPVTTEEHLKALARYSVAFRKFAEPPKNSRLETFLRRLEAIDTATVYPLLLMASDQLYAKNLIEFNKFLNVLESFLVRRLICGLTTKNYNRLFLEVIKALNREQDVSADALKRILQASNGDSVRFPSDDEFKHSFKNRPIYKALAQYKIRAILEALDQELSDKKSEMLQLPPDLTIEHVMPVKWEQNWSIPAESQVDPEAKLQFIQARNEAIHTIGNLTLITGSLNPALSNDSWANKRPELFKFSRLNLNRYFHPPAETEKDALSVWDEGAIADRADYLFKQAVQLWSY